jgi:hypothetical protein
MAETELKTVEQLLVERMDELHYETYPSETIKPIYQEKFLVGDYFPLHLVKTVCERYAEQLKPNVNDHSEEHF